MYDYIQAAYKKAETYFNTALMLEEHEIFDESTLIVAQIATECYLSSILEVIRKQGCIMIFGKGKVPHNTQRLYDKIYPSEKSQPPFLPPKDIILERNLLSFYEDYNAVRFATDPESTKGQREVTEETIINDIQIMKNVQQLAEHFHIKILEKNKNEIIER